MRSTLLLLLAIIACNFSYAQTDTLEYYLNHDKKVCKPENSFYYRQAYKEGNWWHVKDFYIAESSLQMDVAYSNHEGDTFDLEEGIMRTFYPNRVLQTQLKFHKGLPEGVGKRYDTAGRLTDSGFYRHGMPCKVRYQWYSNGTVELKGIYNDTGTGEGEEWHYFQDGTLVSHGKTSLGYKKDSTWIFYYNNGNPRSIEQYNKGLLTNITCYDENGKPSNHECVVELMPSCEYDYNKFLAQHVKYPKIAKRAKIEGTVYVNFAVDESGQIINAKAIGRHLGGGCDDEAIRVVSLLPKCAPGLDHNLPVKVYYILPIRFKLTD